jgi:hypothetical protein
MPSKEKVFSLRIPEALRGDITVAVSIRRKANPKFSINDWFLEAAHEKIAIHTINFSVDKSELKTGGPATLPLPRGMKKQTAAAIASRIPGVQLGITAKDEPRDMCDGRGECEISYPYWHDLVALENRTTENGGSVHVGDAPVEDVQTRPWLPELKRITEMGECDPSSAADEFQRLLGGEKRLAKKWQQMPVQQRAKWLDENYPLEVA